MESFYGGQAKDYDSFRKKLLHGREDLWKSLPKPKGGVWVDMGGGTGSNIENLGDEISKLGKVYVVDLSESLLEVAQSRFKERGWDNAVTAAADATKFCPDEGTSRRCYVFVFVDHDSGLVCCNRKRKTHLKTWRSHWRCRLLRFAKISW